MNLDNQDTIYLFIDSNIYLGLFELTSKDLDSLSKLIKYIEDEQIIIFLPEQVKNEFYRNRDRITKETLNEFTKRTKEINTFHIPNILEDDDNLIKKYTENKKIYVQTLSDIQDKIEKDIEQSKLKADKFFNDLKKVAQKIETTDSIYNKSLKRFNLGNYPQFSKNKKHNMGDTVIWESLLSEDTLNKQDLYFVSTDSDFSSNKFFSNEWKVKKESEIIFYNSLSNFFGSNNIDIRLEEKYKKGLEDFINRFYNSGSFSQTDGLIKEYNAKYKDKELPNQYVEQLKIAIKRNDQIYGAASDSYYHRNLNADQYKVHLFLEEFKKKYNNNDC